MANSTWIQFKALTKKNLRLLILRHWAMTLFLGAVLPVLLLAVTLNLDKYAPDPRPYGLGSPRPISSIQSRIGGRQLVIVRPPNLAPDVDRIIQKVTEPLRADQVMQVESIESATRYCPINFRGVSNCYATIIFRDTPETRGGNATWAYSLQTDPVRLGGGIVDTKSGDNEVQVFWLPVQLAVDNAITNSTDVPLELMYSTADKAVTDQYKRSWFLRNVIGTLALVFFLSMMPFVYHVVSFITTEREQGISALIDGMGGSPAVRILSYMVSFATVYFPIWLLFGVLYWHLIFPDSSAAIMIFWQLFSGMAMLNASIFAATFFRGPKISSIFVCICFLCLAGGAMISVNRRILSASVIATSLLFPSMNYIYAASQMSRFPFAGLPVSMTEKVIPTLDWATTQSFYVPIWVFFVLLVVQILVYPVLAWLTERGVHGLNTKNRLLGSDPRQETADAPGAAVRITGLSKAYTSQWKRWLGLGKAGGVKALDELDLVAHKRQILCLLGVNGAGKSTTLDILAGAHPQTSGQVFIDATPSKLGICPQRNVLFHKMTVYEHVKFWSELKGATEDPAALEDLIEACDLSLKRNSRADNLSGGQKRKLQLACMFVGGSTVCLMDEVTSGLDPLSRRTIWNIILAERSKRSMIFTTHFLDEADVLADHIVILSRGRTKCQGSGAELKSLFGGGYRVSVPKEKDMAGIQTPKTIEGDKAVYQVPSSHAASQLIAQLKAAGQRNVQIKGPTIEDVFLDVAQQDMEISDSFEATASPDPKSKTMAEQLSTGKTTSFFQQVLILVRKRFQTLPRYWVGAFLTLALPIACMPPINVFIYQVDFVRPTCAGLTVSDGYETPIKIVYARYPYHTDAKLPVGPPSANATLLRVLQEDPIGARYNISHNFDRDWTIARDRDEFLDYVKDNLQDGVYMGGDSQPGIVAYAGSYDAQVAVRMLALYTAMRSDVKVDLAYRRVFAIHAANDKSWTYLLYANLIFAVYPAFFALYPAFEKSQQIRALQYSNGVRPLPLWTAYFLFDLCFVVIVSVAYTVTVALQFPFWWQPAYMFPVCLFHGINSILIAYIISTRVRTQLASFVWTLFYSIVTYFGLALAYSLPNIMVDVSDVQKILDAVTLSLSIFFPIGSVFRAMSIGLNTYQIACRDDMSVLNAGSFWGYGASLTYLILQVLIFSALLTWLNGGLTASMFRRRSRHSIGSGGSSNSSSSSGSSRHSLTDMQSAAQKEARRVGHKDNADLLRLVHVSKSFGQHKAVDDVSLGLGQGEILALLGPNGAGKTTVVNMIRGEMHPTEGNVYLRDIDVTRNPRQSQKSMGVCPQFDALDLLTTRQHLEFYGRVKGITNVRSNVELIMQRVGLTAHASKNASKLSGGNKRKLSLAIALIGNPDVLILDEPSSSMDAAAKRLMWKILAEIAPGRSLLLTTHSMEEADALATRAAILSQRLLALGTTQSLRRDYANMYQVHLVLATAPHSTSEEMGAIEQALRNEFTHVSFEGQSLGGQIRFTVPAASIESEKEGESEVQGQDVGPLIEWLEVRKGELGIQDYSIGAPTLERVFLSVVKDAPVGHDDV